MSKVKFIQWGTDANPKPYKDRWHVDEQGSITESSVFTKVKEDYKGGIIFVTYFDAKDKITQEIWANGVQYSVGGGGGNIIYGDTPVDADGKAGDVTGDEGYIYIYKSDTTQTAYYWNDGQWKPFNIDAENIYFPNGFERTAAFGIKAATADKAVVNDLKPKTDDGKVYNLKEALEYYLVEENWTAAEKVPSSWPTPIFQVRDGGASLNVSKSGYVLLNSEVKLNSATFNPAISAFAGTAANTTYITESGSYTFGPSKLVFKKGYYTYDSEKKKYNYVDNNELSGNTQTVTATVNISTGTPAYKVTDNKYGNTNYALTKASQGDEYVLSQAQSLDSSVYGTHTISLSGTYDPTRSATYTTGPNNTTITQVTIPSINTVYVASNKGNLTGEDRSEPLGAAYSSTTLDLPSKASYTKSTASKTYTVYMPLYNNFETNGGLNFVDSSRSEGDSSNASKYTGAATYTFRVSKGSNVTNPTANPIAVRFPSTATVSKVTATIGAVTSTLKEGAAQNYKVNQNVTTYKDGQEKNVSYNEVVFHGVAYSNGKVTINITLT